MKPVAMPLSDGRWHFQHGPIDIVVQAKGDVRAVEQAHQAAWTRFSTILTELVSELSLLKSPLGETCALKGEIAKLMWQACRNCQNGAELFITPMAAVAGSVAQCLIEYYEVDGIERASINNGGDIALYLNAGQVFDVGLFADLAKLRVHQTKDIDLSCTSGRSEPVWMACAFGFGVDGKFRITADMGVQGIATSGWRGRSFSLGIADSVTVLASSASCADAAATLIANAVQFDHPGIVRRPAHTLKDDSDLGDLMVTVDVPALADWEIECALQNGLLKADELKKSGLIFAGILSCQGWFVSTEEHSFKKLR